VSIVITVSFAASSRLLSIKAQWQTERQPPSAEMQVKPDVESLAIGETGGSGWIWLIWSIGLFEVNRLIRAGFSET
jgi:hypothetical protein